VGWSGTCTVNMSFCFSALITVLVQKYNMFQKFGLWSALNPKIL